MQGSQGQQENQNPIQTYMSAIQTVIEKLDEVKNDVKKNTDSISKQVNKIDQVQYKVQSSKINLSSLIKVGEVRIYHNLRSNILTL